MNLGVVYTIRPCVLTHDTSRHCFGWEEAIGCLVRDDDFADWCPRCAMMYAFPGLEDSCIGVREACPADFARIQLLGVLEDGALEVLVPVGVGGGSPDEGQKDEAEERKGHEDAADVGHEGLGGVEHGLIQR